MTNIEFTTFVEQGTLEVFLNDEGFSRTVRVLLFLFEVVGQFVELVDDEDAVATICLFSRFDYPNVSEFFVFI